MQQQSTSAIFTTLGQNDYDAALETFYFEKTVWGFRTCSRPCAAVCHTVSASLSVCSAFSSQSLHVPVLAALSRMRLIGHGCINRAGYVVAQAALLSGLVPVSSHITATQSPPVQKPFSKRTFQAMMTRHRPYVTTCTEYLKGSLTFAHFKFFPLIVKSVIGAGRVRQTGCCCTGEDKHPLHSSACVAVHPSDKLLYGRE